MGFDPAATQSVYTCSGTTNCDLELFAAIFGGEIAPKAAGPRPNGC